MSFKIITSANARKDIHNAVTWENTRNQELGSRFLKYLNLKFDAISITPFLGTTRYADVRYTTIDVFEYMIHYIILREQEAVIILRVLHVRQKPTW